MANHNQGSLGAEDGVAGWPLQVWDSHPGYATGRAVRRLTVGSAGELDLPEEERQRWGLRPGGEVLALETPDGLLLRPANPPLARVYVEPTSNCNLSCRTCVRRSWTEPSGTMAMETYRRLIEGLRAVPTLHKVSLWGFGEPLLHPQIVEMVALAKGLGSRTEIISNGLLLHPSLSRDLVAAGLDSIVFSLDGTSAEAYADVRPGADLALVEKNVGALREARNGRPDHNPEIGIEFVATRSSLDQLAKLRTLALRLGASFIVVTNVLPYTREMSEEVLYSMAVGVAPARLHSAWLPDLSLPTMDVRWHKSEPLLALMEQVEGAGAAWRQAQINGAYCRFVGEGAVAVRWDGGVSPCVGLMHTYSCFILGREKLVKRYVVGNVAERPVGEIWADEEYRRFRARVQEFDFAPCSSCGGCYLAETNEEDCFGNTFPVCGDCLWAWGVIQCP